jgi:hypothetical protein
MMTSVPSVPGKYVLAYDSVSEALKINSNGTYSQIIQVNDRILRSNGKWNYATDISDNRCIVVQNGWYDDVEVGSDPASFERSSFELSIGRSVFGATQLGPSADTTGHLFRRV